MRKALNEHNRERVARGEPPIDIGVGVNTGKVIWGTIGSEVRMKSAIIGDTVNLASRLQNLTKHCGVGVLVSESAFREISNPERFCYREIDVVQVRGKTRPVVIFLVSILNDAKSVSSIRRAEKQFNEQINGCCLARLVALDESNRFKLQTQTKFFNLTIREFLPKF
jgi:class 3 adenylate cyclase